MCQPQYVARSEAIWSSSSLAKSASIFLPLCFVSSDFRWLRLLQKAFGLSQSGVVDDNTWTKLIEG